MSTSSREPESYDGNPESRPQERTGHPLFPRSEHETGPDRRRIDLIHIERVRDDGTWEACPKAFKAGELRSWKDIVDLYGGGAYRARAQCAKTYQWQGTTERKEFAGPSKPFVEEQKKPAAPAPSFTAPPSHAAPPPPHGPAAGPHAPSYAPPAWAPPSYHEPPPWVAVLVKALDRPAPPPQDSALVGLMFKAMADQNALIFKMLAERQAPPPAAPTTNPLEVIRELKPLLDSNTAPGQFMQGIEIAKSLMQQSAPAAPPQEDFATTLAGIMRNFGAGGILPGIGAPPVAPAPPPAAPSPPAPPPPAPTMEMDDMIRLIASNRDLTQRFIQELRRRSVAVAPAARPAYEPPQAPAPPAPVAAPPAPSAIAAPPPPPASSLPTAAAAAPVARPEGAAPRGPAAPLWGASPGDDCDAGTTVATPEPPPSDADGGAFGPVDMPAFNAADMPAELRALLASVLADSPASGAEESSPDTGAARSGMVHQATDGPAASVLLALTGRQKGQA